LHSPLFRHHVDQPLRHNDRLDDCTAFQLGGVDAQVSYAGAQGSLVGLDQVNALIPRSLIGRGEADVVLTVDGRTANTVQVSIK
jgi:uncharacterized protein (TIGR03437 family)